MILHLKSIFLAIFQLVAARLANWFKRHLKMLEFDSKVGSGHFDSAWLRLANIR